MKQGLYADHSKQRQRAGKAEADLEAKRVELTKALADGAALRREIAKLKGEP